MSEAQIFLNGEPRVIAAGTDIIRLLELLALQERRVAVELNGAVVRRDEWSATRLSDGDRLEVVHFVGGG